MKKKSLITNKSTTSSNQKHVCACVLPIVCIDKWISFPALEILILLYLTFYHVFGKHFLIVIVILKMYREKKWINWKYILCIAYMLVCWLALIKIKYIFSYRHFASELNYFIFAWFWVGKCFYILVHCEIIFSGYKFMSSQFVSQWIFSFFGRQSLQHYTIAPYEWMVEYTQQKKYSTKYKFSMFI